MVQLLRDIRWELRQQRKSMNSVTAALAKSTLDEVRTFTSRQQYDFRTTLKAISEERLSFARFGDGELKLILRADYNLRFQNNSDEIRRELRDTLSAHRVEDGLLVDFPHAYADAHWTEVWLDLWREIQDLLPKGASFGNSHVSRPIFFQQVGWKGVELWRKFWEGRRVCVISGRGSRFERKPELFDNVAAWEAIYSLPSNAFTDIPEVLKQVDLDKTLDLFLIALGPAGTILAREIVLKNRQAIDIGHLSDSFENVFEGGSWPESKSVIRSLS